MLLKTSGVLLIPFSCIVGCGAVLKTTFLAGTVASMDTTRGNGFSKASFAIRTKNSAKGILLINGLSVHGKETASR